MQEIPKNLLKVLKYPPSLIIWIIVWGISFYFMNDFLEYMHMVSIEWVLYANIEYYSNILLAILIGLFIAAVVYKFLFFKNFNKTQSTTSLIWGMAGMVAVGCPACTITLGSYIWLSGILTAMPFLGLEIKIIWILLMIIWITLLLKDLEVCKINFKQKNK